MNIQKIDENLFKVMQYSDLRTAHAYAVHCRAYQNILDTYDFLLNAKKLSDLKDF